MSKKTYSPTIFHYDTVTFTNGGETIKYDPARYMSPGLYIAVPPATGDNYISEAQAQRVVELVTFKNPAISTQLVWLGCVNDKAVVQILTSAPERDNGSPIKVYRDTYVSLRRGISDFLYDLSEQVMLAWKHELLECMHFDGCRLRDPHRYRGPVGDEGTPITIEPRDLWESLYQAAP